MELKKDGDKDILFLSGSLGDHFGQQLAQLRTSCSGSLPKDLFIDFTNVTLISSIAIRDWVKFVDELPEDQKLYFLHCPGIVVLAIVNVPVFGERAKILSINAELKCDSCEVANRVTLRLEETIEEMGDSLTQSCASCGGACHLNVPEEDHLESLFELQTE